MSNRFLFGKKTVRSDYGVIAQFDQDMADRDTMIAGDWIQHCIRSRLDSVLAYVVKAERSLLVWVQQDRERDHLGRPKGRAFVAQVSPCLTADDVLPFLSKIHQLGYGSIPESLQLEETPVTSVEFDPALLIRLRMSESYVCVDNVETATSLLRTVGAQNIDWFAVPSDTMTPTPPGAGIVLSACNWIPDSKVVQLCRAHYQLLASFPFANLFSAPRHEHPVALNALLGSKAAEESIAQLSWGARYLLAKVDRIRPAMLTSLPERQVTDWIHSDLLEQEDLSLFVGRVSLNDRAPILRAFNKKKTSNSELRLYYDLFPGDVDGLLHILSETVAETWNALRKPGEPVVEARVASLWKEIADTPWLDELDTCQLANCVRLGILPAAERFHDWLLEAGVDAKLASFLLGMHKGIDESFSTPTLDVKEKWIHAVSIDALLELLNGAPSPKLKDWAAQALDCLQRIGLIDESELLRYGIHARNQSLLTACNAPMSLMELACGHNRVHLPPSEYWPCEAAELLVQMIKEGDFFERVEITALDDFLVWTKSFAHDALDESVQVVRTAIPNSESLPIRWLKVVCRGLERLHLIRQFVAWGASYKKKEVSRIEYEDVIDLLLRCNALTHKESKQLESHALLRYSDSWTVEELIALFPALDIHLEVLPAIESESFSDSDKKLLREAVLQELNRRISDMRHLMKSISSQ